MWWPSTGDPVQQVTLDRCNEIDTLVSVSLLYALRGFHWRGHLTVCVHCFQTAALLLLPSRDWMLYHQVTPPPSCDWMLYRDSAAPGKQASKQASRDGAEEWQRGRRAPRGYIFRPKNETTASCIICIKAERYSSNTTNLYKHMNCRSLNAIILFIE